MQNTSTPASWGFLNLSALISNYAQKLKGQRTKRGQIWNLFSPNIHLNLDSTLSRTKKSLAELGNGGNDTHKMYVRDVRTLSKGEGRLHQTLLA